MKWLALAACLLALAALSFYSVRAGAGEIDTLQEIVGKPREAAGLEIGLTSDTQIVAIRADEAEVRQGNTNAVIRIPSPLRSRWEEARKKLEPGEYVSLSVKCSEGGHLEALDFHIHEGRRFKIWISAAALALTAALIYSQVRRESRA